MAPELISITLIYDKCNKFSEILKRLSSLCNIRMEVFMKEKKVQRPAKENFFLTAFIIFLFLLNLAMPILFPGCLSQREIHEAGFTPGIYEGSGRGYRGPVHVSLQISQAGIEDIVITNHTESAYPGVAAMEELLEMVLETGSTDLDAISGATYSSRGFLEAVEDAIRKRTNQK